MTHDAPWARLKDERGVGFKDTSCRCSGEVPATLCFTSRLRSQELHILLAVLRSRSDFVVPGSTNRFFIRPTPPRYPPIKLLLGQSPGSGLVFFFNPAEGRSASFAQCSPHRDPFCIPTLPSKVVPHMAMSAAHVHLPGLYTRCVYVGTL